MFAMNLQEIFRYIDSNHQNFIKELVSLVKQPSVSAKNEGIQECAKKTESIMTEIGFSTKILQEKGNPVVYGELSSSKAQKTLLFYNHYDVQPPEPIEEWICDPFSGEIKEGRIYGRGVSDNKGNIISRLKAVQSFLDVYGEVPINIKFVIEGEEEIGSPNLYYVMEKYTDLFYADAAIWEFGGTDRHGGCTLPRLHRKGDHQTVNRGVLVVDHCSDAWG